MKHGGHWIEAAGFSVLGLCLALCAWAAPTGRALMSW